MAVLLTMSEQNVINFLLVHKSSNRSYLLLTRDEKQEDLVWRVAVGAGLGTWLGWWLTIKVKTFFLSSVTSEQDRKT